VAVLEVERKEDGIVWVFLNRTEKVNALNRELWDSLAENFKNIAEDDAVRVVLLAGRGEKGFSSGLDLMGMPCFQEIIQAESPSEKNGKAYQIAKAIQEAGRAMERVPVPVIALIHGYCIGGAVELVASADIRIATKDAVFSLPEVDLGIAPDLGGPHRLQRLIGLGWTKRLIFTVEKINGEKALQIGLVEEVVENREELFKRGEELAKAIAEKAPLAIKGTKAMINQTLLPQIDAELEVEARISSTVLPSQDVFEGMMAKMEKRKPRFKGK
jgi:enoyl-CoA hydratase